MFIDKSTFQSVLLRVGAILSIFIEIGSYLTDTARGAKDKFTVFFLRHGVDVKVSDNKAVN